MCCDLLFPTSQTDGNRCLRPTQIQIWALMKLFCFHCFWMLMEQPFGYCCPAVRLLCWLLTTRLRGVLSSLSLMHCAGLDFCLSVCLSLWHSTADQVSKSGCLCESGDTPWFSLYVHFPRSIQRGVASPDLLLPAKSKNEELGHG